MTCDHCRYSDYILVQKSNSKGGPNFGGLTTSSEKTDNLGAYHVKNNESSGDL